MELSTTAGDGAEDLEFGKGEGGPREGGRRRWAKGRDNCSWADLKLHLFDSIVIFEIVDWGERKFSYVHWTPSSFANFTSIFVRAQF